MHAKLLLSSRDDDDDDESKDHAILVFSGEVAEWGSKGHAIPWSSSLVECCKDHAITWSSSLMVARDENKDHSIRRLSLTVIHKDQSIASLKASSHCPSSSSSQYDSETLADSAMMVGTVGDGGLV